jgi:hypothetical protein
MAIAVLWLVVVYLVTLALFGPSLPLAVGFSAAIVAAVAVHYAYARRES